MSTKSAAATVAVMGVTYLFCEALASALALAVVGALVGIAIVGGAVILGLVTYCAAIGEAAGSRDTGWLVDLLLAPVLASVLVLFLFHPIYHLELHLVNSDNSYLKSVNGNPPPISHAIVALLGGLAAFFIVIIAPVLAVWGMRTGEQVPRKAAYLGFLVTAVYWETVAIVLIKHVHS
jgi:hypothetical protein